MIREGSIEMMVLGEVLKLLNCRSVSILRIHSVKHILMGFSHILIFLGLMLIFWLGLVYDIIFFLALLFNSLFFSVDLFLFIFLFSNLVLGWISSCLVLGLIFLVVCVFHKCLVLGLIIFFCYVCMPHYA